MDEVFIITLNDEASSVGKLNNRNRH